MKTIIFLASLIFLQISEAQNLDHIYEVIKQVETRGNSEAIGDGGKAFGPVQIHSICVRDVNRIYGTKYKHSEMFDDNCAREVFKLYLGHGIKLFKKKHGTDPITQDIVRMWNGGIYSGYRRQSTLKYYRTYLKFEKLCKHNN